MDAIRLYLKDIKNIALLTPEQEQYLARRIRKGDKEARMKMIKANLRLVINIAKRYKYFGVSISDLIEEGNLGLMKAVTKFDPRRGYRFSTYASWWIKQYITRAIANQGKTIRIPVYMAEIITRWRKVTEQLAHKLGRSPRLKEVARVMKMSIEKVMQINEIAAKASSLDAPIGEDGSGQFMDLIEDENILSPTDELTKILQKERIDALLDMISEREKEILNLRFGLKDGVSRTLGETAKRFNITRERVRQIEVVAMRKLKLYLAAQEGISLTKIEARVKKRKAKKQIKKPQKKIKRIIKRRKKIKIKRKTKKSTRKYSLRIPKKKKRIKLSQAKKKKRKPLIKNKKKAKIKK